VGVSLLYNPLVCAVERGGAIIVISGSVVKTRNNVFMSTYNKILQDLKILDPW
jgi:hypothetical protein